MVKINLDIFGSFELWKIILFIPFYTYYLIKIIHLFINIIYVPFGHPFVISENIEGIIFLLSIPALSNVPMNLILDLYNRAGFKIDIDEDKEFSEDEINKLLDKYGDKNDKE